MSRPEDLLDRLLREAAERADPGPVKTWLERVARGEAAWSDAEVPGKQLQAEAGGREMG